MDVCNTKATLRYRMPSLATATKLLKAFHISPTLDDTFSTFLYIFSFSPLHPKMISDLQILLFIEGSKQTSIILNFNGYRTLLLLAAHTTNITTHNLRMLRSLNATTRYLRHSLLCCPSIHFYHLP